MLFLAGLDHGLPESTEDPFEERDNPLPVVESFGRYVVDRLVAILGVTHAEVEGEDGLSAATFLGRSLLVFVGQEVPKGS